MQYQNQNQRETMTGADERLVMYERRRMRTQTLVTLVGLVIFGYFFMNYLEMRDTNNARFGQSQYQIDGTEHCTGLCDLRQFWHNLTDNQVECHNGSGQ